MSSPSIPDVARPGTERGGGTPQMHASFIGSGRTPQGTYQLRFRSLSRHRGDFAFPCDAGGRVDIDSLAMKDRVNYLYARACIGRDFLLPRVEGILDNQAWAQNA